MQHGQYAAPEAAPPQHGPYAAPVQQPPVQYSSVQYSSVPSVQHSSMQHAPAVINKHQQSPPAAVLAYQNQPQQFGLEKKLQHGVEKEYEHGVEQSALQEKAETSRKRHLEDEEGFLNPKRMLKQPEDNEDSEEYICLWDFLAKNPCKPYTFGAGSSLGSIPPDKSINLAPLPVRLCSDGFIQEVSLAHEQNLSWAGQFNEKNMLVRKKGPLCVKIAVQPKFEATDQNVDLDYLQIVKMLLSKIGEVGNRPPYFGNLILRIQELPTLHEDDREVGIWLIRNHPANLGSPKNRVCMEEFYIFYNTLPVNQRGKFMESVRTNSSERWHLSTVPRDEYLTDFYWIKGNHQRPTDFRVESYIDTQKLKFLEGVSLEEQELITAYYFEAFFPEFLGKFFSLRTKHRMLAELIETYVSRSSVAMRAYE